MNPIYKSRRRSDIVIRALCVGAALFGVTWLALILITLVYNGLAGLSVQLFTQNTPPPGSTDGGLLNAIVGSVIMTVIGVGIGAPLGLFAGTYLAEYGRGSKLADVIRFLNDILLGNIRKAGMSTDGIRIMHAMGIPALGMMSGLLIALFVSYRKPRDYEDRSLAKQPAVAGTGSITSSEGDDSSDPQVTGAASTAEPQPPKVSQKVPIASAAYF